MSVDVDKDPSSRVYAGNKQQMARRGLRLGVAFPTWQSSDDDGQALPRLAEWHTVA
jgi:hypothetical protein